MPSAIAPIAPFQRSWLYRAPGETPTLAYLVFIHATALAALILLPVPDWRLLVAAIAVYALGGLGTTVAYHRALTHRAVTLHAAVLQPLVFFAMANGSGNPRTWVANHRHHHAHSDSAGDISSPHFGGFWWSHLRWLWQADPVDVERLTPDMRGGIWRFWTRAQAPVLALACFGGLALWPVLPDWQAALAAAAWLGPIRLVVALHVQCSVNSLCHLGPITAEHGSGRNIWWMAPLHLFQGENWHANHHRRPADPRLGTRWWQVDIGWWTIRALGLCRLATRIRQPRA